MITHHKDCKNECPKCGNIETTKWDPKEYDDEGCFQQVGFCPACNLTFTEYSGYRITVWEDDEPENIII